MSIWTNGGIHTPQVLRTMGRDVPENARNPYSDEYAEFVGAVDRAIAHQQANEPKAGISWQDVEKAKDRVEAVLAAHRAPIRFEAQAIGSDIYLASEDVANITAQIAGEIAITTGAHEVGTTNVFGTGIVLHFGDNE